MTAVPGSLSLLKKTSNDEYLNFEYWKQAATEKTDQTEKPITEQLKMLKTTKNSRPKPIFSTSCIRVNQFWLNYRLLRVWRISWFCSFVQFEMNFGWFFIRMEKRIFKPQKILRKVEGDFSRTFSTPSYRCSTINRNFRDLSKSPEW